MHRVEWDKIGERRYEAGLDHGVLYKWDGTKYSNGVAWNGLTAVNETPSGAESNPQYADNIVYINLISAEEFAATIEALTYPDEFAECDGSVEVAPGVYIGQQARKMFGFSYRSYIGDDVNGQTGAYKLHMIYGCQASVSEKGYQTINNSPEAIAFNWEVSTTPVNVPGYQPTSILTIDSSKTSSEKMKALEDTLYGTEEGDTPPRMPMPGEIIEMMKDSSVEGTRYRL